MQSNCLSFAQYDRPTGDLDELIVAMSRTENAPTVDLINSASVSPFLTQPFMTLCVLPSFQESTLTEASCSRKGTARVKKRRKYLTARQMLEAKHRGEYVEVSLP